MPESQSESVGTPSSGMVPLGMGFKRCDETRAHYAHEWYNPIRQNCPGGPDETPPPVQFEWDITVRRWDYYGNKVEARTPAKVIAADRAEVTTKVRAMFGAKYDDFRKFWSHDWTLNSARELSMPPASEVRDA
ncbi:MAG: hypothetical protein EPO65_00490 [Dehalococcoidia bacterium]|nr:MAG: hypothetical protein EPO65_00490 [Dehalococcoidia bacterium]